MKKGDCQEYTNEFNRLALDIHGYDAALLDYYRDGLTFDIRRGVPEILNCQDMETLQRLALDRDLLMNQVEASISRQKASTSGTNISRTAIPATRNQAPQNQTRSFVTTIPSFTQRPAAVPPHLAKRTTPELVAINAPYLHLIPEGKVVTSKINPPPGGRTDLMDLDFSGQFPKWRVKESEKERRKVNHLCTFCGGANHEADHCPMKTVGDSRGYKKQQIRGVSYTAGGEMTVEQDKPLNYDSSSIVPSESFQLS
jgi:hypothetical protein